MGIKTRPQCRVKKMRSIKIRLLYVRSAAVGFTVPYIIVSCRNSQRQLHRTPRLGILPRFCELHLQRRRPQFRAVTKFTAEHRQSIPETRRDEPLFVKYY